MSPNRPLTLAALVLLAVAMAGTTPVPAQEDLVTLTVSVSTPEGTPVQDARLVASWDGDTSQPRTTAANGKAFISVPSGEDVEIRMTHDDYVRNAPFGISDASEREVSMTVYEKASARVVVEDDDGPVEDATVRLQKNGLQVVEGETNGDGVLRSGTIESGTYAVDVSKAGYYAQRAVVQVSDSADVQVTVERGTVTLEVNVTDDHFDPPRAVGDASVDVAGSGSVSTQPTGIGRISVPVNAWATVDVDKEGYEPNSTAVYVGESDAEVALIVQRTPAISVELLSERVVIGERVSLSVTDEYGDPVSGASVRLDGEAVTETDGSGQAVVRVESAGNHTVVVEKGSLSTGEHTVVGVGAGDGDATEPTEQPDETESTGATENDSGQPGFGLLAALLAVGLLVGLGWARR